MTGEAGRDLNYLAASGILQKFRRSFKSPEMPFPGSILTYYAGGSIYTFMLILQSLIQNNLRTVIDSSLTLNLAYTASPVLLDAYLTGPFMKPLEGIGRLKNEFTMPHHCVYKCEHGEPFPVYFIFKPGGKLYEVMEKARFGSTDNEQVDSM